MTPELQTQIQTLLNTVIQIVVLLLISLATWVLNQIRNSKRLNALEKKLVGFAIQKGIANQIANPSLNGLQLWQKLITDVQELGFSADDLKTFESQIMAGIEANINANKSRNDYNNDYNDTANRNFTP
jgi:hypothetical protein